MIRKRRHRITDLSAVRADQFSILRCPQQLSDLIPPMLDHIVAANLLLQTELFITSRMRTRILRDLRLQKFRVGTGNVRGQRLLLCKLTQTSCCRTLVLEGTAVLSCDVHVNRTLIGLGVVAVRTLERAIGEADVFVRHFG